MFRVLQTIHTSHFHILELTDNQYAIDVQCQLSPSYTILQILLEDISEIINAEQTSLSQHKQISKFLDHLNRNNDIWVRTADVPDVAR